MLEVSAVTLAYQECLARQPRWGGWRGATGRTGLWLSQNWRELARPAID